MAVEGAFLTGFPGFLGSALLERLLERRDGPVHCLVQAKYRETAAGRARDLADDPGRVVLHVGDITEPDLGLSDRGFRRDIDAVYHLAALYDLGVAPAPAERVNVEGTEHVLGFAAACPGLERFHHVSTCYVSGRHPGVFGPDDFDVGQSFNNHYEATKFRAERAVRERMAEGLPATIYRSAIAVGDSETGATRKHDGPYQVVRWLLRQPRLAVMPVLPGGHGCEVNVVPRDYVVDALAALSAQPDAAGEVYHLCDPAPLGVDAFLDALATATDRRVLRVPTPKPLLRAGLRSRPGRRHAGIQPALVDYFDHPTSYVAPNTRRALSGSGIECPPFEAYVDTLVGYVREHPEADGGPMA